MFKITKGGATVAMTEAPNYIKQAENGCFVLCPEAEATGIAHNGTVYHLLGRPDMAGAEITVMLEETDAGVEIAKAADAKATQGDTGHAQASMVTEVYAHILDEERKINAQKFEVAFYANPDMRRVEQELNPPKPEPAPDLNLQSLLAQLQENPELARQLKALLHAG